MPFNHHLGLHVSRMHKDGISLDCTLRPEMLNWLGTLHGGVTATLVDAAIGVAVIALAGGRRASTVDMTISYLRPGTDAKYHCQSRLRKMGKTLAFGDAEVRDSHGHLIATGTATYVYLEEDGAGKAK